MTQDKKTEASQLTDKDNKLIFDGQSIDWYLQSLVAMVNETPIEFGVTLHVEGTIISGNLISGKKYFQTFADDFSNAYPSDNNKTKESLKEIFSQYSVIYDKKDDTSPPPQFIHLNNATVFLGNTTLPSNTGVLWRGKINAISGFNLGSLSK